MEGRRARELAREYAESFVVAILIAVLVRVLLIGTYRIPTVSMLPSLQVGDFIFSWRLPYGIRVPILEKKLLKTGLPPKGKVVIYQPDPGSTVVSAKRVIGLPGDRIEIRNRKLIVNEVDAVYEVQSEQVAETLLPKGASTDFEVVKEKLGDTSYLILRRKNDTSNSNFGPFVVPDGRVFILGDNRDSVDDGRQIGDIPLESIDGTAQLIWLSLDWEKMEFGSKIPSVRWSRLLSSIQ